MEIPGKSFSGPLPPLTERERALVRSLRRDVEGLGGKRSYTCPARLAAAADWVEARLREAGHRVERQAYALDGQTFENLETVSADPCIVIGAHYDSVMDCPAANDNGSGVAALLELARVFRDRPDLRFVAFVNEEPPFFHTEGMGSRVYVRHCMERGDRIQAMLCLETIGYYTDKPGTQTYPVPGLDLFYPDRGNFLAFVANQSSYPWFCQLIGAWRERVSFPSEGLASDMPMAGLEWSDHWSFWEEGIPAVMVTDTAPFRYPHHHTLEDTPDKLTYPEFARVVAGLESILR